MNKIILSLGVLAVLSTSSFAAQRSVDPETTLGGRTLTVVGQTWDGNSAASAFAVDAPSGGNSAKDRLEMNADHYQYIR